MKAMVFKEGSLSIEEVRTLMGGKLNGFELIWMEGKPDEREVRSAARLDVDMVIVAGWSADERVDTIMRWFELSGTQVEKITDEQLTTLKEKKEFESTTKRGRDIKRKTL